MSSSVQTFNWQPFSDTSIAYLRDSLGWMNIAEGSVRSGKTITVITRFIEFILTSPHTDFCMVGKTLNTLERNVVKPFKQMLSSMGIVAEHSHYFNEITFLDKTVALYGLGKHGDDEKIQGSTFAGALIDEGTVINEEAFKMLISRNSLNGAKMFITCNPANPNHYLYDEYLTDEKMIQSGRVRKWKFKLEDNTTLSQEYIENLKASYKKGSLFYRRYIDGEWVSGQGAIFDSFTEDNILHDEVDLSEYITLGIGSDYGTSTTTCYSLVGIKQNEDGQREYHVLDERYYNAQERGVGQTDAERVEDILQLQEDYKLGKHNIFYASHDAESLRTALEKDERIKLTVDTFMPDTLDCINRMSSLFHTNQLRIHERCKETIKQVQGYEWDSKASQRGEDKPVKKDDHLVDSMRGPIMHDLTGKRIVAGIIHL